MVALFPFYGNCSSGCCGFVYAYKLNLQQRDEKSCSKLDMPSNMIFLPNLEFGQVKE